MKILSILFIIVYGINRWINGSGSFQRTAQVGTNNTESNVSTLTTESPSPKAQTTTIEPKGFFTSAYGFLKSWFLFLVPFVCKIVTVLQEFIK
ncbi:unnamed protein product [Schistosoma spindalis]|nr:unnamed protein product [Schistosoma spindale]